MAIGEFQNEAAVKHMATWPNIGDEPSNGNFDGNFLRKSLVLQKYLIDFVPVLQAYTYGV